MPGEFVMVSSVVAVLAGGVFLRLCGIAAESERLRLQRAIELRQRQAEEAAEAAEEEKRKAAESE